MRILKYWSRSSPLPFLARTECGCLYLSGTQPRKGARSSLVRPGLVLKKMVLHVGGTPGRPSCCFSAICLSSDLRGSVPKAAPSPAVRSRTHWPSLGEEHGPWAGGGHARYALLPPSSRSKLPGSQKPFWESCVRSPTEAKAAVPFLEGMLGCSGELLKDADSWALLPENPFHRFGVGPRNLHFDRSRL